MAHERHDLLRKGVCLTVCSVCLFALWASGLSTALAQGWRAPWRTFTAADGLASDAVSAVYETQDGALWFGTAQGVSRYDGEWNTYSTEEGLAHSEVTAIAQGNDGKIWVGTRGGLSCYDGRWVTIGPSDGMLGQDISAIAQLEDGSLWVGTLDGGLSRLQDGQWQHFTKADGLPSDRITAMAPGRPGGLWIGTPAGLAYYEGESWQTYTATDGLLDNMVTAVLGADDGSLWVGTLKGLNHFHPGAEDSPWQSVSAQDGLAGDHVTALIEDSEHAVWACTTEGVSVYDGQRWQTWDEKDGIASGDVRAMCQDSDGGLWLGTTAGVSCCDLSWRSYSLPETEEGQAISAHDVSALAQGRDGVLWITTLGGGAIQVQDGRWHTYTSAQGLADDTVFALVEDTDGAFWFGTAGGVSRYLAGTWKTFTTTAGLPNNVVLAVEADDQGALWFGTAGGGVARYHVAQGWRTFTQDDGLTDNHVRTIRQAADGTLWLGTPRGASRFDGRSWQTYTSQSTNGGLPGDEVRSIHRAADGSLCFATNQGAACYDGVSWQTYDKDNGLPTNDVNVVWKGAEGRIWFGTSTGLACYDGQTWQAYTSGPWLPSYHVLSIVQSSSQVWWIGTVKGGLARYQPDRTPPWARVITVNNSPALTHTLTLPAGEQNVIISFDGGDIHTGPDQLLYMHRLEGIGGDWTYGWERFSLYSGLKPDTYRFWLMARDADFNYSQPTSVTLILPPLMVSAPAPPPPSLVIRAPGPAAAAPRPGWPWQYGWLGIALPAAVGLGYWSYGRWQARRTAGRGFNPYVCGPPIHDDAMFFGRANLLTDILQIVHNNNIIIYGERRIGKTTLLYQLARRLRKLEDPEYLFFTAFVNLQGIPQDRLFLLIAQAVAQELEHDIGTIGLICRSRKPVAVSSELGSEQDYTGLDFQEDVATMVQTLQAKTAKQVRLIFLMDEADIIGTYDHTIQEQLRGVLMSALTQQIKVVLAGTYISKEWHLQSSPWYNLFSREIMLPLFDEKDIKRLIQQPVRGIYDYEPEAVERIITYSDLKPFEAQKLCLYAVKEMLARKRRRITILDVETALRNTLEERALEFEQIWAAVSPAGQRALRVLVSGAQWASSEQAQEGAKEQILTRLPLSDEDRRLLMEGGVLGRTQRREYLLSSFQEWIRRGSP